MGLCEIYIVGVLKYMWEHGSLLSLGFILRLNKVFCLQQIVTCAKFILLKTSHENSLHTAGPCFSMLLNIAMHVHLVVDKVPKIKNTIIK